MLDSQQFLSAVALIYILGLTSRSHYFALKTSDADGVMKLLSPYIDLMMKGKIICTPNTRLATQEHRIPCYNLIVCECHCLQIMLFSTLALSKFTSVCQNMFELATMVQ